MSKEYADKLAGRRQDERVNQKPVGTGPFTFVGYQQDAVIRYKKNADYWGGKRRRSTISSSPSRPTLRCVSRS
jgi:ABC-type transport system substrate-binding protein